MNPSEPATAAPIFETEVATYEVFWQDERIGELSVHLVWNLDGGEATSNFTGKAGSLTARPYPGGNEVQLRISHGGRIEELGFDNITTFPLGLAAKFPVPRDTFFLRHPLLASYLTPLGPQVSWRALGMPSSWADGSLHGRAQVNGAEWVIIVAGPCEISCTQNGYPGPAEPRIGNWTLEMAGGLHETLPTSARWQASDANFTAEIQRISSSGAGRFTAKTGSASPDDPFGSNAFCSLLPCEEADRPPYLSFQRAMAALESQEEWQNYADESTHVFGAQIDPYVPASLLIPTTEFGATYWLIVAQSTGKPATQFILREAYDLTTGLRTSPSYVDSMEFELLSRRPARGEPYLVEWDTVLQAVGEHGVTENQITLVEFALEDDEFVPGLAYRYRYGIYTSEWHLSISATTGRVWYIEPR